MLLKCDKAVIMFDVLFVTGVLIVHMPPSTVTV